jgi:hypothetical protein
MDTDLNSLLDGLMKFEILVVFLSAKTEVSSAVRFVWAEIQRVGVCEDKSRQTSRS